MKKSFLLSLFFVVLFAGDPGSYEACVCDKEGYSWQVEKRSSTLDEDRWVSRRYGSGDYPEHAFDSVTNESCTDNSFRSLSHIEFETLHEVRVADGEYAMVCNVIGDELEERCLHCGIEDEEFPPMDSNFSYTLTWSVADFGAYKKERKCVNEYRGEVEQSIHVCRGFYRCKAPLDAPKELEDNCTADQVYFNGECLYCSKDSHPILDEDGYKHCQCDDKKDPDDTGTCGGCASDEYYNIDHQECLQHDCPLGEVPFDPLTYESNFSCSTPDNTLRERDKTPLESDDSSDDATQESDDTPQGDSSDDSDAQSDPDTNTTNPQDSNTTDNNSTDSNSSLGDPHHPSDDSSSSTSMGSDSNDSNTGMDSNGSYSDEEDMRALGEESDKLESAIGLAIASYGKNYHDILAKIGTVKPPTFNHSGSCDLSVKIFGSSIDLGKGFKSALQILRPIVMLILNVIFLLLLLKLSIRAFSDITFRIGLLFNR